MASLLCLKKILHLIQNLPEDFQSVKIVINLIRAPVLPAAALLNSAQLLRTDAARIISGKSVIAEDDNLIFLFYLNIYGSLITTEQKDLSVLFNNSQNNRNTLLFGRKLRII